MITLLLVVIAVLLYVLASKIAPEELNYLWLFLVIGGVFYLLFEYGIYILALGYYLVVNSKNFFNFLLKLWVFQIFEFLIFGSLVGYWIWLAYVNREKIIKNFRAEFYNGLKLFLKGLAMGLGLIIVVAGTVFLVGSFFMK